MAPPERGVWLEIERKNQERDRLDPYWRQRQRYGVWPLPELVLFGARMRRGRMQAGMSQRRLAAKAGVSQTSVSRLERGIAYDLGAMRLVAIGMALGPNFPFGCCAHDHGCPWPYDPSDDHKPRPHQPLPGDHWRP